MLRFIGLLVIGVRSPNYAWSFHQATGYRLCRLENVHQAKSRGHGPPYCNVDREVYQEFSSDYLPHKALASGPLLTTIDRDVGER